MTAPNTTNNVTVRKLADVAEGMWNKSKNAFVNASGDTMTGRLTMENVPINQIVTGTGTAATSSSSGGTTTYYPAKWKFDLGIATPSAGDQLVIKIPVAGHDYGTFMSTDNGTTYYPVAQSTGSTRFTTRYPVNAYVFIVFEEYTGSGNSGQVNDCFAVTGSTGRSAYKVGCWRVVNDYDSGNTYDRLYNSAGRFRTGTTGCYPYSLVCLDNTESYSTLVTSNPGTGTNKNVNTAGKFVFPASILYYAGNNTTAAGALVSSTYATYLAMPNVDVRYSSNHTTTFTTHKPVYIECTLNGDGTWSPTSNSITQTLRTGYYYIYLGIAYSTEYQVSLAPEHPLYYYDGTNLVSAEVARGDITSGTNNGELNVAGTDITVYTHPTDAGNKHIPAGGSSGQFLGWDSAGTAKWVSNPNTDIKVKATAKTDDANYKILATASASPSSGAATEAVYDTDITLNPLNNTISANVSGTAASAGKLTTARTTYVTLGTASTSTTRDWSGTTTIPVSGTLGLGNGGTGATSAAGARTNLDVYSKSETESLLNGKVVVVTQLPATGESGVTYYVKDTSSSAVDKYDEYIWAKDAGASTESWIHVGEKSLDLSEYVNSLTTSGTGPLVKSLSKSGNTLTATMGTISIDDLSDWATDTDVTVSSVTYHTWWPVAPTSSNQVYGLSIYNGRLYRIYNNKGTYSAQAYDTNTTYTNKSLGQGYGTCATDAATAAKIVSMSDYVLSTGGIVTVKFTNALCTSATMNINGKGAKPIYIKGAAVTANNAATVSAGDTAYFMYDGTAYHLLGTDRAATNPIVNISRSGTTFTATRLDGTTFTFTQQDNNTTYTQAKLGQGYGTCTTAEATAAKSVTLTGYELEPNGVVAVKFTNGLCASATMSINGKTATPIYINGAAVTSTSCKEVLAGDLAFFIYDGSHYQFICTDRISKNGITGLSISGKTITYTRADGSTGTLTTQDTTYTFDGVYNSSSNKAATVSTVTNAVNALDVDDITGFGAGKTLATLTETDGKIAATFQNISITKSQVSDFSHSHGNITNDGKVGTTADYAVVTTTGGAVTATSLATSSPTTSGNTLEFIDTVSQNSKGKISATKKKVTIDDTYSSAGTNPVSGKAVAAALGTLDVTEVGGDGKYIKAIKETDGKITATVETMDTTPTASSTKAVTSGGIKTALDAKADDSNVVHTTGNESISGRKTFTGMVENFNADNVGYGKFVLASGGYGTKYENWDSSLKDGAHFREWTLAFPTGASFWGRIRITFNGGYYSRNSSGWFSKSIVCAFNTASVYNNTGYYDDLGIHVEEEFRISDLIWDNTNSRWTIKIHSIAPSSNNSVGAPIIEYWASSSVHRDAARQLAWVSTTPSIVTDTTYYTKRSGDASTSPTTGGELFSWSTKPVLQGPYGDKIQYNWYGICSTAAATAAKTVTVPGTFVLEAGAVAIVTFTNANTASTPTLAVNGTAAKNIFVNGAQITTNSSIYSRLTGTVMFIYDGTQYNLIGNFYNSTYNFSGTTFYSGNQSNAEHNANNISYNGVYYWTSNGPTTATGWTPKTSGGTDTDGAIYAQAHSSSWVGQIAQDYRNGNLAVRGKNNGTWTDWNRIVDQKAFASGTGVNLISAFRTGTCSRFTVTNPTNLNDGASFTHDLSTGDSYIRMIVLESIADGETVTLSFDVENLNVSNNEYISFFMQALTGSTKYYKVTANGRQVFVITKNTTTEIPANSILLGFDDGPSHYSVVAPSGFTIKNIKLERGSIATPYSRHPSEDQTKVYYVEGLNTFTAYSSSSTYTKWASGDAYTSSNSCQYNGVAYYCSTAITTAESWNSSHWTQVPTVEWTGTIPGLTDLYTGLKIAYKIPSTRGGSSSTKLNINGLGAKTVYRNTGNTTSHLPAGTIVNLTYDGTYWKWADYDNNSTYSGMVTAYLNNAGDAAKSASSTNFKLTDGITIILTNNAANTKAAALTLNVNSTGAKALYINGNISSSTNYTIPIGTYFCHYKVVNGTGQWHLWTDGTAHFTKLHLDTPLPDTEIASATTWNAKQNAITYMTTTQENELISELGDL
jgi:hypothetical protein